MQTILLISVGAVIGANLRYLVAQYIGRLIPSIFPYGTLIINASASFVLGLFLTWTTERVLVDPRWRIFVATGFRATYSTYSSYAFDTFALSEKGHWSVAALNIVGTNMVCFGAVVLGAIVARSI